MQIARIVQAVVLMLIVAAAASCAATKEYSSKLFSPKNPAEKDSQAVALRFLEIENNDSGDWISTEALNAKDSLKTFSLDNLAKSFPADAKKDSANLVKKEQIKPQVSSEVKPNLPAEEPVAKTNNNKGVRTKRTRDE